MFATGDEKKKFPVVPLAAAVIVLALVGGLFFFLRKPNSTPATATKVATTTASVPLASTTAPVTTTSTAPALTQTAAPTSTGLGSNDQALIDQEVQRRLLQERERLTAQQQRAQQAAAAQNSSTPTVTPAATQTTAPPPQVQPVVPPPTATVAETRPEPPPPAAEPAPQQAAPQRTTREGDLVDAGAEGLVAPELVRMRDPVYPPVAKMRRIQGEVLINVLVNENGRVGEARVVRAPNPDLGFSQAALEAARSATFRPATKDGVRVKTYKTMKLTFKL
jgi:TonB family protein